MQETIYMSMLPLIIISEIFLVFFLYFAITWPKRQRTKEVISRLHESFIGVFFVAFWYWLTEPGVKLLIKFKVTPNNITAFSILLSLITGYLYAAGQIAFAGWMLIITATMDLFDGRVARQTNTSSKGGAFFDSCTDRYTDGFLFGGVALYFISDVFKKNSSDFFIPNLDFVMLLVMIVLLVGTASVSYSKAKGESLGFSTNRGLMQRPERIVLLAIISCTHPFVSVMLGKVGTHKDLVFMIGLIFMSVMINGSAISRMRSIFSDIVNSEKA